MTIPRDLARQGLTQMDPLKSDFWNKILENLSVINKYPAVFYPIISLTAIVVWWFSSKLSDREIRGFREQINGLKEQVKSLEKTLETRNERLSAANDKLKDLEDINRKSKLEVDNLRDIIKIIGGSETKKLSSSRNAGKDTKSAADQNIDDAINAIGAVKHDLVLINPPMISRLTGLSSRGFRNKIQKTINDLGKLEEQIKNLKDNIVADEGGKDFRFSSREASALSDANKILQNLASYYEATTIIQESIAEKIRGTTIDTERSKNVLLGKSS